MGKLNDAELKELIEDMKLAYPEGGPIDEEKFKKFWQKRKKMLKAAKARES